MDTWDPTYDYRILIDLHGRLIIICQEHTGSYYSLEDPDYSPLDVHESWLISIGGSFEYKGHLGSYFSLEDHGYSPLEAQYNMKSFKDSNSYIEDLIYFPLEWRASVVLYTAYSSWVEYTPCPSYSGLRLDISLWVVRI